MQEYVHGPTDRIKHSIVYSSHTKIEGMENGNFKIVPNFRTFVPAYTVGRGELIFVSNIKTSVSVVSAKITNIETGANEVIKFGRIIPVQKQVPDTGYFLGFMVVVDEKFRNKALYSGAKSIKLEITYNIQGGTQSTEVFELKLITRKDVAWVT